jgi:hypothetical protein
VLKGDHDMTVGALFDISLGDRPRRELAPGAVHVPSFGTAPAGCGLTEGRINITMRVTGLE